MCPADKRTPVDLLKIRCLYKREFLIGPVRKTHSGRDNRDAHDIAGFWPTASASSEDGPRLRQIARPLAASRKSPVNQKNRKAVGFEEGHKPLKSCIPRPWETGRIAE